MNKTELVAVAAEKTALTKKDAEAVITAALDAIAEALRGGDDVRLVGFGTFGVRERAERTGKNPRTGELVKIPAATIPTFKPGKALKDAVVK
ncbi:transcriptional regulator [Vescimonas coprocola]|jgi:DNA-binding protein HU|uniref:Transcriptional regulator n=1 Tax=Vescimonas coprocola TaxID=2714355 RepID=A0A810Q0Y8_9FIRM|nr:HU family DNA-binding protein [Vescimonas coprocola]BCK81610.1 transcriptional regulator [Vescimonas coprocola]